MRSMPDTENPRSHIQPVPLPIPSQIPHLRSSSQKESCDCENYKRRRHQMSKCGYRSVIYKPYQPVGEVFLDDRKLILSALGQEQTEHNNQAYLGEKPYLFGAAHTYMAYRREYPTPPPRGHIVSPVSCTCHLLYFLCCLLFLDVVSSFLLTSSCLLVTSKYQLFTTDYVSFILY